MSGQSYNLNDPIPLDPQIRTGVLENGITYYIRHNEQPKERASFYIIQNVGALLEEENQNGLAHFLEHMAFNGTRNFPDKAILNTLEKRGVKFGADINAYTAFNETVYNLNDVPMIGEGILDTCLLVLHDWCDDLLLTDEEIDAERGVISEEWRTRRNASFRLRDQYFPILFNNSKYAERDVIGNLDVINNFEPDVLRKFYHDWYRTDLQAVSVVGDVNVDEVEKKVIELFSKIPAVENPKERPFYAIEDNIEPGFVVATDKEVSRSKISMYVRHKKANKNTLEDYRQDYVKAIFNQLTAARISELVQKDEADFLNGMIRIGNLVDGYEAFNIVALAKEGKEKAALSDIMVELERILRYGFTESELERVKTNLLVSSEQNYKKRDQVTNNQMAKALVSVYTDKVNRPGAEFAYNFEQTVIPAISLEEVSDLAKKYYTDINRSISITGPDKEGIHLSKEETFDIIDNVSEIAIAPYSDEEGATDLLSGAEVPGGKIIKVTDLKDFAAEEWVLSNGAKVVYRFADYEKEQVYFTGISVGGTSLYDDADVPNASSLTSFIGAYGIGDYDAIALKKLMTGSTASTSVDIDAFYEYINGSSAPKDIEDLLKLAYLRFEKPRFDHETYANLMKRYQESLKNRNADPRTFMKDTLSAILLQNNPRYFKRDTNFLKLLDYDALNTAYLDRFKDASDFTFFIVGDIDKETVKPLVEKYLGSIPDYKRKEEIVDRNINFPQGKNEYKIPVEMEDNKATVIIKMQNDAPFSTEELIHHKILSEILRLRYTEEIREKEGGTYGVSVSASSKRLPSKHLGLSVQFDCDPAKAEYLKTLIYKEMKNARKSISEEDLNKVVLNMKKDLEEKRPHNSYWLNGLVNYYKFGENITKPEYNEDIINKVTIADIEKAAKWFFKNSNVVDVTFYPEAPVHNLSSKGSTEPVGF